MSSKANYNKATEKDQASTRSENMATASMPDALPEDLEKLRSILLTDMTQAVHSALKNELETALTPVNSTLEQVKSYYESHDERIRGVEDNLSDYSDRLVSVEPYGPAEQWGSHPSDGETHTHTHI